MDDATTRPVSEEFVKARAKAAETRQQVTLTLEEMWQWVAAEWGASVADVWIPAFEIWREKNKGQQGDRCDPKEQGKRFKRLSKAEFLRLMPVGSKWLFTHNGFPDRGERPREVIKHERGGRVVFKGPRTQGSEDEEADLAWLDDWTQEVDENGTIYVSQGTIVLTYRPVKQEGG